MHPVDERPAGARPLQHLGHRQHAVDVGTVGEQHHDPPSLAPVEPLQAEQQGVVERGAAGRLDSRQGLRQLGGVVAERRRAQQAIGKQHHRRLVELAHAVEEDARAGDCGIQPLARHAGADVEQQHGGQRHVAALEGDDLLALAVVDDPEVVCRQVEQPLAATGDRDVQLLQLDAQLVVDVHRTGGHRRASGRPRAAAGDRLDPVLDVLVAQIQLEPPGRLRQSAQSPAVDHQVHLHRLVGLDVQLDLDLAVGHLAGRRPVDPDLHRLCGAGHQPEHRQHRRPPHPPATSSPAVARPAVSWPRRAARSPASFRLTLLSKSIGQRV